MFYCAGIVIFLSDRHQVAALQKLSDPIGTTRAQIAEIFNQHGLRILQNKEWAKSLITEPLKRARAIFREEEKAQISSIPNFGLF